MATFWASLWDSVAALMSETREENKKVAGIGRDVEVVSVTRRVMQQNRAEHESTRWHLVYRLKLLVKTGK